MQSLSNIYQRFFVASPLLQKLAEKKISKENLYQAVEANFELIPEILNGVCSSKASVRYGCASVLVDLSAKYPDKLYPYFDWFIELLDSKYRILTWNAMAAIANLCSVDTDRKFDAVFDKYYGFLEAEYLVTVANVVVNSAKIALAKPYLIPKITQQLLKVQDHSTSSHLTEECKRVIAEKTLETFNVFFSKSKMEDKPKILALTKESLNSPRASLKAKADRFVKRWS
jgi:hypothetical protein